MTELSYRLRRSHRRSICVKICADNSVEVTAPYRTTIAEVERFLKSKDMWIRRHIEQNSTKLAFFDNVLNLKTILVTGVEVPLIFGKNDAFHNNSVEVRNVLHLKELFISNLAEDFFRTFNEIKSGFDFKCGDVTFRDYKSRWGSCFEGGKIVFNYKLLMLPKDVQIYVIVHELCHTREMNHSVCFYKEVSHVLPDYKQLQKKLKQFSPIVGLY